MNHGSISHGSYCIGPPSLSSQDSACQRVRHALPWAEALWRFDEKTQRIDRNRWVQGNEADGARTRNLRRDRPVL